MQIRYIEDTVGATPLVGVRRVYRGTTPLLLKLESANPGGSVKDRPAISMLLRAEKRGQIVRGDHLIEATSGNTGIGLAFAAAALGYRLTLVIPEHLGAERRAVMRAYGAEVIVVSKSEGMEGAITRVRAMEAAGEGIVLNQYDNPDNPAAHFETTGPEIWEQTDGRVTHFVAALGTTGTVIGVSRYLRSRNPAVKVVGVRPDENGGIPGIRNWTPDFVPGIFDRNQVDEFRAVSRATAVEWMARLAREEGIFAGVSSGANLAVAVETAERLDETGKHDAVVVAVICDRGDRYLSTGAYGDIMS